MASPVRAAPSTSTSIVVSMTSMRDGRPGGRLLGVQHLERGPAGEHVGVGQGRRAVPPARGREGDGLLGGDAGLREVVLAPRGFRPRGSCSRAGWSAGRRPGPGRSPGAGRAGRAGGRPRRGAGRPGRRAPAAARRGRGRRAGARARRPRRGRWRARPPGRRRGGPGAARPPCAATSSAGRCRRRASWPARPAPRRRPPTSPSSTASSARCTSTAGASSCDGGSRAIARRTDGAGAGQHQAQAVGEQDLLDELAVACRGRELEGLRRARAARGTTARRPPAARPSRRGRGAAGPPRGRCAAARGTGTTCRCGRGARPGRCAGPGRRAWRPSRRDRRAGPRGRRRGPRRRRCAAGSRRRRRAGAPAPRRPGSRPPGRSAPLNSATNVGRVAVLERQRRHPHPGRPALGEACAAPPGRRRRARCRAGPRSRRPRPAVKASWAARTSCSRPVRRSRCRPIGGSKRQPSATRTRPSAHSTRCWMPSSTSRVAHLVHVVEDEDDARAPRRRARRSGSRRRSESAGPAGASRPGEHRRGVGGGLAWRRGSPRSRSAVPSSSRSQVTQATGTPAARCWSAQSASIVVLP